MRWQRSLGMIREMEEDMKLENLRTLIYFGAGLVLFAYAGVGGAQSVLATGSEGTTLLMEVEGSPGAGVATDECGEHG